jgi:hypothetical protein
VNTQSIEEIYDFTHKSFEEMQKLRRKNIEEMQEWYYTVELIYMSMNL